MMPSMISREQFLTRQTSTALKGLFAFMVLLSHLHGRVQLFRNSLLGTMLSACGYLAVAGFFFVSGYGLFTGSREKEDYIDSFPKRKILPFYAMCIVAILIYALRLLLTGGIEWIPLLQSFFFGGTVVQNGWYLQAQLILYIIFYFSFRFSRNGILWVTVLTVLYCVVCAVCRLPTTWYESVLCFPLGMFAAKSNDLIVKLMERKKQMIISVCFLTGFFLITLFLGNKRVLPEIMRIAVKMLSAGCFTCVITTAFTYVCVRKTVLDFVGGRSFSVYVLQGVFLSGYRPIIENDWLYMIAVVASVMLAAIVMQPVFSKAGKQTTFLWKKQ